MARAGKENSARSGQWTVSVHHLPGELFGAAMSRRTLFLTPEILFQFKIRARESIIEDCRAIKKSEKGVEGRVNFFVHLPFSAAFFYNLEKICSASVSPSVKRE